MTTLKTVRTMMMAVTVTIATTLAVVAAQQPPAAKPQPPLAVLRAGIERTARSVNATWGIYIKSIETGEEIAIDADRQMDTMSVIKIPLMVEVFEQIKAGKLSLSEKYTLTKEDVRPGTGIMRSLDAGAVITLLDLITLMNIVSDNTATDVLFKKVGGIEPVNARMKTLGLTATRATGPTSDWFTALSKATSPEVFHREAKTPFGLSTPRETGTLLEMMARKTLVDAPSSERMLQIMSGQIYRSRIPRYLSGYRVPHKTGDFLPYIGNDVGLLIAPGRTIVISIYTANHFGDRDRLEEAIGDIARQVAQYYAFRQP
jgi:beta-lactamase class A